jgi:hypothetical protein
VVYEVHREDGTAVVGNRPVERVVDADLSLSFTKVIPQALESEQFSKEAR